MHILNKKETIGAARIRLLLLARRNFKKTSQILKNTLIDYIATGDSNTLRPDIDDTGAEGHYYDISAFSDKEGLQYDVCVFNCKRCKKFVENIRKVKHMFTFDYSFWSHDEFTT